MLLRGTLAAAVLLGCAFISASFFTDSPRGLDLTPASGSTAPTLVQTLLSLGSPVAAAALATHPTATLVKTVSANATAAASVNAPVLEPFRYSHPVRAKSGDTLTAMLVTAGVERRDAVAAIDAMRNVFDPRRIRPGHEVNIVFERATVSDTPGDFMGFTMTPSFDREVEVARAAEGGFAAIEIERTLTHTPARASGSIGSSLFFDGEKAGIPVPVLIELIRAYSWDVDFQRDIWPGDTFDVMWQRVYDDAGNLVSNGDVLYAKLTLTGTPRVIYRHEMADGDVDYFDEKGQSARKALMRTPIDGARLSSRYGKRKHPILGYTKMHRGVDFAASIGTPIYAAGDGRIEMAGRNGAYGNYIRIRHNSDYSTAYAHLSRFARGTAKGKRVRQGQVIGYVGNTGRTTGPHLHYEILRGGKQTNPLKVRMPSGKKLKGKELARFEERRAELDAVFAKLAGQTELAGTPE